MGITKIERPYVDGTAENDCDNCCGASEPIGIGLTMHCTRSKNHKGKHVAHGVNNDALYEWENE
jgi:hypothetical protein